MTRELSAQALLDALPAAAVLIAPNGAIVAVNDAWVEFCLGNGGELAGVSPPADYLAVCDGATGSQAGQGLADGIRAVLDGSLDRFEEEYPCHGPQVERWFRMIATPTPHGALIVHLDITGEYERVSRFLASTPTAIIELDPDGHAVFVNTGWARTAACSTRELLGADWSRPVVAADRESLMTDVLSCAADLRELTREVRVHDSAGERWVRFTIDPYVDDHGTLRRITLVGMDVTGELELVRAQSAADERQRIGADIHDTVIQRLFSAGIALQREIQTAAAPSEVLGFALSSIDDSISDLRSITRPAPRAPETLSDAAVAAVLDRSSRALGFAPEHDLRADLGRIGVDASEQVVAVLSEGLANVARHAHATACHVLLTSGDDGLTLRIADNGIGMPALPRRRSGTGNIARRAESLGGRADWSAGAQGGTVMTWWVPLSGG